MISRPSDSSILRFGIFELNVETGELRKAGARINLPPQPSRILALLANRQGELVTREEIQQDVWGDKTFVDFDRGLNFAIMKIRTALSDDADTPRYVETLPRRGYRFIAPVHKDGTHAAGFIARADATSARPVNELAAPADGEPECGDGRVRDPEHVLKTIDVTRAVDALPPSSHRVRPLVVAVGLAAGVLSAAVIWSHATKAPSAPTRFPLWVPEGDTLVADDGLALSPNGRSLVYGVWHNGTRQLFRRALEQTEAVPIAGTEGGAFPFFSPDGQWIGFFANNALKKVPLLGGPTMIICPAGYRRGASWGPNGVIVFASGTSPDLMQVADTGGTPRPVTAMAQRKAIAAWPELTPDGRAVLYTIRSGSRETNRVVVRSIDSGKEQDLVQGTNPRLTSTGHLVFARLDELWVVPFDNKRLAVTGPPAKALEDVEVFSGGLALFSVAHDGSLVHATPGKAKVVVLDRSGRADVLLDEPHRYYSDPQPSPDGRRLALAFSDRVGENSAIYIYDLVDRQTRPLTFDRTWDDSPLWTPNSQRIVFSSDRAGSARGLFWTAIDGGVAEPLTSGPVRPGSWTSDGRVLAFFGEAGSGIWTLGVNPARKPELFLQAANGLRDPRFSPDGRWLAYSSRESGQDQVYVRPFPTTGGLYQVSLRGGVFPRWSPDGKELFYLSPEFELMAAAVTSVPTFQVASPRALFKAAQRPGYGAGDAGYSVMPDGQHFVMLQPAGGPRQIQVTLNWMEDLKQRGLVR